MTIDAQHRDNARADLCRFLSACYYEPSSDFGEERLFDSMIEAAARVHADLAAHALRLGAAFVAQDLQTLLVDYTRLFLGPVQPLVAPYGSVWLTKEGGLMQASTMDVLDLYRKMGFDVDEGFLDLPDHVAVELEFLYLLTFSERQRRTTATDEQAMLPQLRRRFLNEHLGAWIDRFTACVESSAETPFYRELATLTKRFVQMEKALDPPQ